MFKRQDMGLLDGLQGDAGLDARDSGQEKQAFHHQFGKSRQIGNGNPQHVIGVATNRETVHHFRHRGDSLFKRFAGGLAVTFQDDLGESGDPQRPTAEGASMAT